MLCKCFIVFGLIVVVGRGFGWFAFLGIFRGRLLVHLGGDSVASVFDGSLDGPVHHTVMADCVEGVECVVCVGVVLMSMCCLCYWVGSESSTFT